MGTRRIAAIVLIAVFLGGIALDKLWLAAQVPLFSNGILVRPGLVFQGHPVLPGFTFGLLTPLLLTLAALALLLFPWTHRRYPVARKERFILIRRIAGFIIIVPLWILSAGLVYQLIRPMLPPPVALTFESFGFQPAFFYGVADDAHRLIEQVDGSVACLLGLLVGLAIVYYKIPR